MNKASLVVSLNPYFTGSWFVSLNGHEHFEFCSNCLNPYFTGSWFVSAIYPSINVTLSSLNPYFTGSWFVRSTLFYAQLLVRLS